MAHKHMATYLNDHLMGARTAIELLEQLEADGSAPEEQRFAAALRADIEADRQELTGLMARLQIQASAPRQAAGWLAEKLAQLKLRLDDPADGALRLLETFDTLAIGIEGKRALWQAQATAAADNPGLQGVDYDRLVQRAIDQRSRVETRRLAAARSALAAQ